MVSTMLSVSAPPDGAQLRAHFERVIADFTDEEMRALLIRRRGITSNTPLALSTAEGIIAGLVAGGFPSRLSIQHPP